MKFFGGVLFSVVVLGVICQSGPILAQSSAPAQDKPALYEFSAHHCIPCKEMKMILDDVKASHGDQVEIRLINAEEEKPLFGQYRIVAVPTLVYVNAEGKEVDRHLGALPKDAVLKKLKELNFIR